MARTHQSTRGTGRSGSRTQARGGRSGTGGALAGRRGWNDKEIGVLREMAATRPVGLIANKLGRSVSSVRSKAASAGISFESPERSPYGKPVSARRGRSGGARRAGRSTAGRARMH